MKSHHAQDQDINSSGNPHAQGSLPKAESLLPSAVPRHPNSGLDPPPFGPRTSLGEAPCSRLSTIQGQPGLTSHNGGTMGGGCWVHPKVLSANVAANLGEVQALQLRLYFKNQSGGTSLPSPQWVKLKMGKPPPSLGEGSRGARHESKQAAEHAS